ncbi:glycosyltransferase family 2 protein [Flavobacteriaceae bacterium]|nr:glycosyltransferase family 2 protein [Flavobacteriaceae bacterium]
MLHFKIIVVTFNSIKWIDECLASCEASQTIVIDNASTDSTVIHIRKNYPEVTLIENKSNIGFGQANNIGIQKAISEGADYVFLLNQDAYLGQDCIEKLIEVHQNNPEYGILSPMHLDGNGTNFDWNFSEYLKRISSGNLLFDFIVESTKNVYPLPFVNAAGWLLPKSTVKRVGLFDPMFFHYGEDENYCQRVRAHGLKVGVVPTAHMRHDRENRMRSNIPSLFDKIALERRLKLYLGDINITPDFNAKKRVWRNEILKSLIKFDFRTFYINLLKFRTLILVIPEILESRERNKILNKN